MFWKLAQNMQTPGKIFGIYRDSGKVEVPVPRRGPGRGEASAGGRVRRARSQGLRLKQLSLTLETTDRFSLRTGKVPVLGL